MNRPLAVLPTLVPAALAGFACHTLPGTASLAPNDSTVCYALRSGPWTSWIPHAFAAAPAGMQMPLPDTIGLDRKSTRLNSSHLVISYAVFCLKKKQRE